MPIAYRSLLRIPAYDDLFLDVEREVSGWLSQRRYPLVAPIGVGTARANGAELSRTIVQDGQIRADRWTLRETWDAPRGYLVQPGENRTGVTTVTLAESGEDAWFWVDVDAPALFYRDIDGVVSERTQYSATPGILKRVLEVLEPIDGSMLMTDKPVRIDSQAELTDLISALSNEQRMGAIFVAAPSTAGKSQSRWRNLMEKVAHEVAGMATVVTLSPDLVHHFNLRVGHRFSVQPGGIRTYLQGLDLEDDADSFRHRWLSPRQVEGGDFRSLSGLLRNVLVHRGRSLRIPSDLRGADYSLLRAARHLPLDDLKAAPQAATGQGATLPELDELRTLVESLKDQLLEAEKLADEFFEEANAASIRNGDLADEKSILGFELDDAVTRNGELQDTVQWLRRQLQQQGNYDAAYAEPDDVQQTQYPNSFAELLDQVSTLEMVIRCEDTAVRKAGQRLDDHPNTLPLVHKAWDCLLSLNDYATLKKINEFEGSLRDYLADSEHKGRRAIIGLKSTESDTVQNNSRLAAQRTVRVPQEVDPSGQLMMTCHVALATGRAGSPRLYFHDNTAADGLVYLGYLGEHLRNTKTN